MIVKAQTIHVDIVEVNPEVEASVPDILPYLGLASLPPFLPYGTHPSPCTVVKSPKNHVDIVVVNLKVEKSVIDNLPRFSFPFLSIWNTSIPLYDS